MTDYDRKGTFALFPNKDRKTEKHPNLSGTLYLEDGTEYFIDGWTVTAKNGNKLISGKIKRKQPRTQDVVEKVRAGVNQHFATGLDEDIPFAPEFR